MATKLEARAIRALATLRQEQHSKRQLSAKELTRARIGAVRDVVEATLVAAALNHSSFTVSGDGNRVEVSVARADACTVAPADAGRVTSQLTGALGTAHGVQVRVAGTKLTLPRYVKRNCMQAPAATGTGKLVFSSSSSGIVMTPAIRIRNSSWTVEWDSASSLLQIYLYKDGKLVSLAANQAKRGPGTRTFTDPGRYQLKVAGTGDWTVRVRDGA
jgi:hypothetical protein